MRRARWLASWRNSAVKPVFYHCISRVVDRRLVFGVREKEKFRMLMRMQEKFTGCRVLSYCLMGNHVHLLLEVPPLATGDGMMSDEELLDRLLAIYNESFVADVAKELSDAHELGKVDAALEIHQRFRYRMHDLGEFMKTLLQRFTQWFNRVHSRSGRLWEDRFKSVIVEDGVAAKAISAYIDLNPVRAGMVTDPADYRWSSYGEAIGGGAKGNGKTARAGLVRAMGAHRGTPADASLWVGGAAREYRRMLMAGGVEKVEKRVGREGTAVVNVLRKGIPKGQAKMAHTGDGEIPYPKMLRCRIRYFTDGAVIGSRQFVDDAFANSRARFGSKRKNGARRLRGDASPAAGIIWSMRDLRSMIANSSSIPN